MNFKATRDQLHKVQLRLDEYQTALRLAGVELEQRNQGMIALTHFAYQASRLANPATLLQMALAQALQTTNTPVGAIILIDFETHELSLAAHKGLTPDLAQILTGQRWGAGAIVLMPHLVTGSGALLEQENSEDEGERLLLETGQLSSLVSLPLKVGSRLLGALVVGLQGKRYFKSAELCFLMVLSQETAIALENLRLREGLWHTAEAFLGSRISEFDWQTVDGRDLAVAPPPLFDLAPVTPPLPPPIEDDLKQVLETVIEAENEVQQQNADLQAINAIAEMINRTLDLEEILQCTVEQTRLILQADAAWVYLVDEKKQLEMRAHVGLSTAYVRGMRRLQPGDGLEGQVARENQPRFVEAIAGDAYAYKIWVDKEGLQTLAAVPITRPEPRNGTGASGSHVVGVLTTGRRVSESQAWTPREIRLLTAIANQLAPAVDNARLYAHVRENATSLRAGNLVLQEVNDMLIQKNVFLEEFMHHELAPTLVRTVRLLQQLLAEHPTTLTEEQSQDMARLQRLVRRLGELSREIDRQPERVGVDQAGAGGLSC